MDLTNCEFETLRLVLKEWHSFKPGERDERDLDEVIVSILTEPVTRALPSAWQGEYSIQRAENWVAERDAEGTTILAVSRDTRLPIGLMVLSLLQEDDVGSPEIRLGYLLAESAWGSGMATEIVAGFLEWCRTRDFRGTITAGVERDNYASRRVLEKNGLVSNSLEPTGGTEMIYRIKVSCFF